MEIILYRSIKNKMAADSHNTSGACHAAAAAVIINKYQPTAVWR
jgi:hypothetical protein